MTKKLYFKERTKLPEGEMLASSVVGLPQMAAFITDMVFGEELWKQNYDNVMKNLKNAIMRNDIYLNNGTVIFGDVIGWIFDNQRKDKEKWREALAGQPKYVSLKGSIKAHRKSKISVKATISRGGFDLPDTYDELLELTKYLIDELESYKKV
jgi:hypothetical protein